MRLSYVLLALAAATAFTIIVAEEAAATHYRFGVLSWEPTENPNEVKFTGGQAWRRSAFGNPNVGDVIRGESNIVTGSGVSKAYWLKVTTVSTVNDYFVAQIVDQQGNDGILHTYPSENNNGQPWVASFSSCCRISTRSSGNYHVNNPDQSERLETLVDLSWPPNSSPRSLLPPINPCALDAVCSFAIPHFDPDGDDVTFRFATTAEAGDSRFRLPGPPNAPNLISIDAASGVLTWDTTGATVSPFPSEHTLYSVQVMLMDGRTKVPLDFFIELLPAGYSPPYWAQPPSPCGATIHAGAGNTLSFDVRAQSDDAARTIRVDHLGLPAGASLPLPAPGNPAESTFTWTPTHAQAGTHLLLLTAEDDRGFAAPTCAVTLVIVRGDVAARGLALEASLADGEVERIESSDLRRGPSHRAASADLADVASVAGVDMAFDGVVHYHRAPDLVGFARARATAGVVEVAGVLRAEGVSVTAESVIDGRGAESFSEVRFARLSVGGFEVDVSTLQGPATYVVPGVATVHVHHLVDTGNGVHDANLTAYALRVVFHAELPVRELLLVSASADVGRHVEDVDVEARPLPPIPAPPPPPAAGTEERRGDE
ncbi:MAG TPA: hypothetical protein VM582_00950 [Candidatus Thermoplasmatota archaeon]|nr:hypothetical protein [Candidatus Thermoplasmatota archaeon]